MMGVTQELKASESTIGQSGPKGEIVNEGNDDAMADYMRAVEKKEALAKGPEKDEDQIAAEAMLGLNKVIKTRVK